MVNAPLYVQARELDNSIINVRRKLDGLLTLGEEPEQFSDWLKPYRIVDTHKAILLIQMVLANVCTEVYELLKTNSTLNPIINETAETPIEFESIFIKVFKAVIDLCSTPKAVEIIWGLQLLKETVDVSGNE